MAARIIGFRPLVRAVSPGFGATPSMKWEMILARHKCAAAPGLSVSLRVHDYRKSPVFAIRVGVVCFTEAFKNPSSDMRRQKGW